MVYDAMGRVIKTSNPGENETLSPYPTFGDPRDLGTTYSIDGIRVPAEYFARFVNFAFHGPFGLAEAAARASARVRGRRATGVHWGTSFEAIYDENGQLISVQWGKFDPNLSTVNFSNETLFYNSWNLNLLPAQTAQAAQNPKSDEFTPEQLEQFKKCLSEMYRVYYRDHHYDRNGEAYFDGHSDTRAPWSVFKVGTFTVRTDQQSYSSTDLKQKFGPLAGSFFGRGLVVGYTDKRSPYVNAIANDAGVALKGREFLGLWVYELGNALSVITGFSPDIPADAQDRYRIAGEPGAAFSDCVFGGALTWSGSVVRPGR